MFQFVSLFVLTTQIIISVKSIKIITHSRDAFRETSQKIMEEDFLFLHQSRMNCVSDRSHTNLHLPPYRRKTKNTNYIIKSVNIRLTR